MSRAALILFGCLLLTACGVDGWVFSSSQIDGSGTTFVAVWLSDSPVDGADRVWVGVDGVDLIGLEGPVPVVERREQFDLLELQNGNIALLGESNVPPGDYLGFRIHLSPESAALHRIETRGETFPLEFARPGGETVELLRRFTLVEDDEVSFQLDFNVRMSVIEAGASWFFDPQMVLLDFRGTAFVEGRVLSDLGVPVAGATVSAQIQGVEEASARSLPDGRFLIGPLPMGAWDFVATADGFASQVVRPVIITDGVNVAGVQIFLSEADTGTVDGSAPAGLPGLTVRLFAGPGDTFVAYVGVDPLTGTFLFPAVAPGFYTVELWTLDGLLDRQTNVFVDAFLPTHVSFLP
ncbi:MAG: DUF4382 domain-containing protein [Planctomycetota bacterium]|jgi:hypothetical protein